MQERPLFQMQPCILCDGETTQEYIEVKFEYPRFTIIAKQVPAAVCAGCGEQYIPGDVSVWLSDEVAKMAVQMQATLESEDAMSDMVINFNVDEDRLISTGRIRQLLAY